MEPIKSGRTANVGNWRMRVDLHTHTLNSGHAFNSLYEMADEARIRGITLLAVTEHGPTTPGGPHERFFDMAPRIPRVVRGTPVMCGCEANVIAGESYIDLPDHLASVQDIVLAGIHERPTVSQMRSPRQNTRLILKALENPFVDVIAHPYRLEAPIETAEVVNAALRAGALLELNLSLFVRYGHNPIFLRETQSMLDAIERRGSRIVLSSDAHIASELGNITALPSEIRHRVGPLRWTLPRSDDGTRLYERYRKWQRKRA